MFKSSGRDAEKLLARNQKIKHKIQYFEMKIEKLEAERIANDAKASKLLQQERKTKKYKLE